jgi:hypothetical protein
MARSWSSLTAVAPVLGCLAVGCGSSRRPLSSAPRPAQHIVCDHAVDYSTLAQLRRASSSVAVVRPTGRTVVRKVGGVPFTISTVGVVETVRGAPLPATLDVRQTGTAATTLDSCGALVSPGHVYIAYLSPFRLRHRGPVVRGQYSATGLFQHDGSAVPRDPSDRSFTDVSPGAGAALPGRISISLARRS